MPRPRTLEQQLQKCFQMALAKATGGEGHLHHLIRRDHSHWQTQAAGTWALGQEKPGFRMPFHLLLYVILLQLAILTNWQTCTCFLNVACRWHVYAKRAMLCKFCFTRTKDIEPYALWAA
ncbi:unnamed protein product [Durusdinium trenchii]|uniref:Uncharacterized protein n=1 Tax=Durusdinium trenchii TaxID=1381693 RepID=A0ABP0HT26_9DINO